MAAAGGSGGTLPSGLLRWHSPIRARVASGHNVPVSCVHLYLRLLLQREGRRKWLGLTLDLLVNKLEAGDESVESQIRELVFCPISNWGDQYNAGVDLFPPDDGKTSYFGTVTC